MGSIFYTYEEAIEYIENLPKFTEKHTLSHTRNYLIELGIQEDKFKIIHIAGTNGKGSVSAMLSNILVLQNIRTGLFVSPHLEHFRSASFPASVQVAAFAVFSTAL